MKCYSEGNRSEAINTIYLWGVKAPSQDAAAEDLLGHPLSRQAQLKQILCVSPHALLPIPRWFSSNHTAHHHAPHCRGICRPTCCGITNRRSASRMGKQVLTATGLQLLQLQLCWTLLLKSSDNQ